MLRVRRQLGWAGFALPLALLAVAVAPSAASAPTSVLIGGAPVLAPASTAIGPLSSSAPLQLTVVLASRDPTGLDALATAVSTPGSPDYHHYLTVGQFAQRFGATPAAADAVTSTLRADGLQDGTLAPDGLALSVSGDAATVSHAFSVDLERYREHSGAEVYTNTAAARLPEALQGDVTDVLGLNDVPVAAPIGLAKSAAPVGADAAGPALDAQTAGPTPCPGAQALSQNGGPYTINQVAQAYGLDPLYADGDLGAGVTIALYELEPYANSDISTYQACFGTAVAPTVIDVDGGPLGSGVGSGEAALDIENAIGVAPGSAIRVYDGPNSGNGPYLVLQAIVDDPSPAQVVSDSWGLCETTVQSESSTLTSAEYTLFEQAAVQGQSVLAASGDNGTNGCDDGSLAVDDPASQPYVTGVGGTTLSAIGTPPTESVWNTIPIEGSRGGASGGGVSNVWTMPSYQATSNVAGVINQYSSATPCGASSGYCREVPDVSADGNPQTGYVIYYEGGWGVYAGTSAAAPFWAGLIALADASHAGSCAPATPLGFLNPSLYAIAGGPGSADAFNDITRGDNNPTGAGLYPATPGYDLATGLGTPIATDAASAGLVDQLCDAPAGTGRPPVVGGLSVHDAAPGTSLTIDGSGFSAGATVQFGSSAASTVAVASPTAITATVPPGSGTVDVTVSTGVGTSATSSADQFTFAPTAAIVTPANGGVYTQGEHLLAAYSCGASTLGTPTCDGTAANGDAVDTATIGPRQFTVTATDANGVSVSQTAAYSVLAPPKITIARPLNGATVTKGATLDAAFTCATAAPLTIAKCAGSVAAGHRLITTQLGQFYLTVEAVDSNGVVVRRTASYDVVAARATVSSLAESARVWLEHPRAGSHLSVGTRFSFWLDQPATVTVRFTRIERGRYAGARCVATSAATHRQRTCTISTGAGMIALSAAAGHRSLTFAGRASDGLLTPGAYTATVRARGASGRSSPVVAVRFTIAAPPRPSEPRSGPVDVKASPRDRRLDVATHYAVTTAMPDGVLHLSSLAGSPLLDSSGERLGRVDDVVARLDLADPLPPVIGLRAAIGGRLLFVPANRIERLEPGAARTATTKLNLAQFERRPGEVLLRADLLGHSLINVNTARLVRAAEVELTHDDGAWRVAGIDPSLGARFRRLLPRRLRGEQPEPGKIVPWTDLEPFVAHVPSSRLRIAHRRLAHLHPAQIADLVEAASHDEGEELLAAISQDRELEADVFEELDDEHQLEFLDERTDREIAGVLSRMASDDAADLLLEIKQERRRPVLDLLPPAKQRKIRGLLGYNPSTAGGIMSPDFVAVSQDAAVAHALVVARNHDVAPENLHAILVTDSDGLLAGLVTAGQLISAAPEQQLATLAENSPPPVTAEVEIPEVARVMTDYNLVSLPVVDADGRPIGVVSVDDVLELTLPEDWRRRYGLARE